MMKVLIVRVSTVKDFTLESITGPAKFRVPRARVILAVDDTGEVKVLKDNLNCVEVIG